MGAARLSVMCPGPSSLEWVRECGARETQAALRLAGGTRSSVLDKRQLGQQRVGDRVVKEAGTMHPGFWGRCRPRDWVSGRVKAKNPWAQVSRGPRVTVQQVTDSRPPLQVLVWEGAR